MSFYDRYEVCCKRTNIDPVCENMAQQLGCTRSLISTWKKKGTTPNGETVANAARVLDVSADYLLGVIEDPHPIKNEENSKEPFAFSENEKALILAYRARPDMQNAVNTLLGIPSV